MYLLNTEFDQIGQERTRVMSCCKTNYCSLLAGLFLNISTTPLDITNTFTTATLTFNIHSNFNIFSDKKIKCSQDLNTKHVCYLNGGPLLGFEMVRVIEQLC